MGGDVEAGSHSPPSRCLPLTVRSSRRQAAARGSERQAEVEAHKAALAAAEAAAAAEDDAVGQKGSSKHLSGATGSSTPTSTIAPSASFPPSPATSGSPALAATEADAQAGSRGRALTELSVCSDFHEHPLEAAYHSAGGCTSDGHLSLGRSAEGGQLSVATGTAVSSTVRVSTDCAGNTVSSMHGGAAAIAAPPQALPLASPRPATSTCTSLCILGDALELLLAPGDLLIVKGSGRFAEIGTAHGFMGHVLLVVSPPSNIWRHSPHAHEFQAAWPPGDVPELWRIRTVESTRSQTGLHEVDMLLFVSRSTAQLILVGEVSLESGDITLCENEAIEVWQSPIELRSQLQVGLMMEALRDMKVHEQSWSFGTATRAVLKSARIIPEKAAMEKIQACWLREPICTSVAIIFWQRYLAKLAPVFSADGRTVEAVDLILKYMPLKADRVLPGDLLTCMKECGWVCMSQMPRIFRPMVITTTPTPVVGVGLLSIPLESASLAEAAVEAAEAALNKVLSARKGGAFSGGDHSTSGNLDLGDQRCAGVVAAKAG